MKQQVMVIGLNGVQFSLVCNRTSEQQNRTTAKWESDLLINSMITDRIELYCSHSSNYYKFTRSLS